MNIYVFFYSIFIKLIVLKAISVCTTAIIAYDAEDGSCLFGRVLYVNKSSMYKYDYVIDDHATEAFTACWDLSACWLNK